MRLEPVRSGGVGRHAPLAAALVITIAANVVLASIIAVGLISQNAPAAGSVARGLGFLACLAILFVVALALIALGANGFRRRDIGS